MQFVNKVNVEGVLKEREMFTYNNAGNNRFYVSRDSLNPTFDIKFDGEDIIDGDIISAKPLVTMTLKDNSPLPLDSTFFYVYHNNIQVPADSLIFSYTPLSKFHSSIVMESNFKRWDTFFRGAGS